VPSAFNDGATWIASFRALHGVGRKPRRVRIPPARLRKGHEEDDAIAYAREADHYVQLLQDTPRPRDVRHALDLKAITEEQAAALLSGLTVPSSYQRGRGELTVKEAALSHPSSRRDAETDSVKALHYLESVDAFCEFAGVRYMSDVRLDDVMRWIERMRKEGRTFDARRHRLLYLRRACRMAATHGLPDVLSGLKIDRHDQDAPPVKAYTLDEVATALRSSGDDRRVQMALALMAFVGLRPSEVIRARCGDLDGDVMAIGEVRRKSRASRRSLPLPPTLAAWWRELAGNRAADAPLLMARSNHPSRNHTNRPGHLGGRAFRDNSFAQWLGPKLKDLAGRALPPKHLRKTFATWAPRAGMHGRDVERYLGHASPFLAAVTSERYHSREAADDLRPAMALIERTLHHALQPGPSQEARPRVVNRSHTVAPQRRKSRSRKAAS
jgi:integrase